MRVGLAAFGLLGLAACDPAALVTRSAPTSMSVTGDRIVVSGPPGYCVDRPHSRDTNEDAFVLLGSCASLTGRADRPMPIAPAVLTVTVSPELSQTVPVDALHRFVSSPAGLVAISRSGDAGKVDILELTTLDQAVFVHARDRGNSALAGVDETYWRALFPLNGRLVTASVVELEARPLSRDAGLDTLRVLTHQLRSKNPDGS